MWAYSSMAFQFVLLFFLANIDSKINPYFLVEIFNGNIKHSSFNETDERYITIFVTY